MAGKLHLSYPPNIARVTVQRKRLNVFGQGLWHVPFLFLYFFALRACVETSGNPYAEALAHHQAKGYDPAAFVGNAAASKQKPPQVTDDWGGGGGAEDDGWGDLEADDEDTGGAAAAAATEVLNDGAASLTRARDSGPADDCLRDGSDRHPSLDGSSVNTRSAAESLDARLASDVVRRCAVALGQLKGVTATFRMTNKPMPTKPSHFANGVVEPLRRFAESGAVREASAPTRRALVDAAVAGVCAAYEKAAADLTVSVRKTEASLIRLKDRKGEKGLGSSATASTAPGSASGGPGPTDAEKICRQVRLDAEAFGRAVARLGFDPEKSDAFAKLWDVCGEGDAFSSA